MATPFLASILKALERIYHFRPSQKASPESFELDLPIQPVQELGDIAKLGAALGPMDGFWVGVSRHTHTVPGTITSTAFLRLGAGTHGSYPPSPSWDPLDKMAWMYRGYIQSDDTTDFSNGGIAVHQSPNALGPINVAGGGIARDALFYGTTPQVGGTQIIRNLDFLPGVRPVPMLELPGGTSADAPFLDLMSRSGGAGTELVDFNYLFWVGPKGVLPPAGG